MRIVSFEVSGFRSIRHARLDNLGSFNVFYGPNGAGKSNLLLALKAILAGLSRLDAPTDVTGEVVTSRGRFVAAKDLDAFSNKNLSFRLQLVFPEANNWVLVAAGDLERAGRARIQFQPGQPIEHDERRVVCGELSNRVQPNRLPVDDQSLQPFASQRVQPCGRLQ